MQRVGEVGLGKPTRPREDRQRLRDRRREHVGVGLVLAEVGHPHTGAHPEAAGEPLREPRHTVAAAIARIAVGFTETSAPLVDDTEGDRIVDHALERVTSHGEELCTVIEPRRADAPRREPAAHAACLVEHRDRAPRFGERARGDEPTDPGTDHDDIARCNHGFRTR